MIDNFFSQYFFVILKLRRDIGLFNMLHREEGDGSLLFDWMRIVDKYIIYSEHAKAGEWIKHLNGCSVCDFS